MTTTACLSALSLKSIRRAELEHHPAQGGQPASRYHHFDIATVAAYGEADVARLLADPGIIRNRLKIRAAIQNARTIQRLQAEYGSFRAWLDAQPPQDKNRLGQAVQKDFHLYRR